jgi:hypothetical protein
MVWLFAVMVIGIILFEVPSLFKEHSYRELAVFTVFLLMGFYLGMVQLCHWPLYNPFIELANMLEG